jgi:hypothetical protein
MPLSARFPSERFNPGDKVVVTDGTLIQMEGIVLSPQEVLSREPDARISPEAYGGKLCWVLLPIFGREVLVEFQARQLARVEEPPDII